MYDAARASELTAMVVPSPYGLVGDAFVRSLIEAGYIGAIHEVHVHGLSGDLADEATPLGWRQMTKYSGFNMLTLGILYETALRWTPAVNRVFAFASKHVPKRHDPETGKTVRVGIADSLQVLTTTRGAPAAATVSAGSSGTIHGWASRCTAARGH